MARFDCATWMPVANHGGPLARNLGLILHHAVATGSLHTWFDNPSSGVSAHFWVAQDGRIEQYVDSEETAWHAMQLNDSYCGVETEGCAAPPHADPMSDAMVDALARLYAEGNARHGWPLMLAESDGQAGFGYHRMAVATGCPCEVRLAVRPEILTLAGEILDADIDATPAPTPPPGGAGAPPFPYPAGHYLGQPSPDPCCHSGYYGGVDNRNVATWQARMAARGWALDADGCYGPASETACRQFQAEKGLAVDGLVGPDTWQAAWTAPVT